MCLPLESLLQKLHRFRVEILRFQGGKSQKDSSVRVSWSMDSVVIRFIRVLFCFTAFYSLFMNFITWLWLLKISSRTQFKQLAQIWNYFPPSKAPTFINKRATVFSTPFPDDSAKTTEQIFFGQTKTFISWPGPGTFQFSGKCFSCIETTFPQQYQGFTARRKKKHCKSTFENQVGDSGRVLKY